MRNKLKLDGCIVGEQVPFCEAPSCVYVWGADLPSILSSTLRQPHWHLLSPTEEVCLCCHLLNLQIDGAAVFVCDVCCGMLVSTLSGNFIVYFWQNTSCHGRLAGTWCPCPHIGSVYTKQYLAPCITFTSVFKYCDSCKHLFSVSAWQVTITQKGGV